MTESNPIDIVVVGGGPAGMSAAIAAAGSGASVMLVDERPTLGGQVYKQLSPGFIRTGVASNQRYQRNAIAMLAEIERSNVAVRSRTAVVAAEGWDEPGGGSVILVTEGQPAISVRARRLVVAAGAFDRPMVFPGWTLPGVMTAGGVQSLTKTQRMVPSGRVVFAGSGPVALAFPAQLLELGANVVEVLEAGRRPSPNDLVSIARATHGNVDMLRDAVGYLSILKRRRVPLRYRRMIIRCEGSDCVERVVHVAVDRAGNAIGGTERTVDADVACLGYGFQPSLELIRLLGCDIAETNAIGDVAVELDDCCRTSVSGVYAAGDGTAVEGVAIACEQGTIAGLSAALDLGHGVASEVKSDVASAARRIDRRRRLQRAAEPMYRLSAGIYSAATPDTIVCRCESVNCQQIDEVLEISCDINVVKSMTRTGMGLCQGRSCQRHVQAMISRRLGTPIASVRPATARMPLRPVPLSMVADSGIDDPGLFLHDVPGPGLVMTAVEHHASTISARGDKVPSAVDVVVIGGGIAGTAIAYYLASAGVEVLLLERGELNREASGTNAGSLHLQLAIHQFSGTNDESERKRLLTDLGASIEAVEFWGGLAAELGASVGLHVTGGWMVAETPVQTQVLIDKHDLELRAGLVTEVIAGQELRERAPFLSDSVQAATYCPAEGNANPLIVTPLFARRAVERGADIRTHVAVSSIELGRPPTSPAFTIRTSVGTVEARRIVNCAGAWCGDIAGMVGLQWPVRQEGLHVNVTDPRPRLLPSMVQHIGRRLTLKQAANGSFIIGGGWPTPLARYPQRSPTTWRSAAGNAAVAIHTVPGVASARLIRTWSGTIVFTDDFSPIIGESQKVPGFLACVASTGFTFGPIYARRLSEAMLTRAGRGTTFPATFSLDRPMRTLQEERSEP